MSDVTNPDIQEGFGLGATFGLEVSRRFSLGLGYDRLFASSEYLPPGGWGDNYKYDFPADAFRAFGLYSFSGLDASGVYLGGSLGLVTVDGSAAYSYRPGYPYASYIQVSGIKGSGRLFDLFIGGDWWTARRLALTGSAGYRSAKIGEVTVNEAPSSYNYFIDYSGVFAQVGFKVALTK